MALITSGFGCNQEIHDCSTPLSAEDLHHIHVGPRQVRAGWWYCVP